MSTLRARAAAVAVFAALCLHAVSAQAAADDGFQKRVVLMRPSSSLTSEEMLIHNACVAVISDREDVISYLAAADDIDGAKARALAVLAGVVVEIRPEGDDRWTVTAFRSRPDDPNTWDESSVTTVVEFDRSGRYQRPQAWTDAVLLVREALEGTSPAREVTVRAPYKLEISGLPEYAHVRFTQEGDAFVYRFLLLQLSDHELHFARPGFRSVYKRVYVERENIELAVALREDPRHSVAFFAEGVSWPSLEYQYYFRPGSWVGGVGVTSYTIGLAPLAQTSGEVDDPKVFSGHPLTILHAFAGRLWRAPEKTIRPSATAGAVVRLVHTDGTFGVDPVVPAGLRIGGGFEAEWGRRLVASAAINGELLFPVDQRFSFVERWVVPMGRVWIRLPVARLGVRVVL